MAPAEHEVDVLICGGGPIGLLLSYQLTRMGLTTFTIEKCDKANEPMYGRAATLYPRTLEMLDQLDLQDSLNQIGFIGRGSNTFRDGKKVHGRGWTFISRIHDTFFDYILNIRQKYSEDVFRGALERSGGELHSAVTLKEFSISEEEKDDYRVTSILEGRDADVITVRSKYIIGADGGRSTVRKIAEIPFLGQSSASQWIRIDGIVKTNMPDARVGLGSIESRTHGNVVWVPLDHGRTRIGFVLSTELYKKYGHNLSEEDVKREAAAAVSPFELEFITVDWWTLYGIGQRVADTFYSKERILLAGDACHTHSSGSAQGMNTGVHDATNLGWKLAGVLKGWYSKSVLETYSEERRMEAQRVITLDKTISTLVSGKFPEDYNGNKHGDVNDVLEEVLELAIPYTIGLGIHYQQNILNKESVATSVEPGWRSPDVLIHRPGSRVPVRLLSETKNHGKFWILVFAGNPFRTASKLEVLRDYLDGPSSFVTRLKDVFEFGTIIAGVGPQPEEVLGVECFGAGFYDPDDSAHARFGISTGMGAIIILRPDGILGFSARLEEGEMVAEYLEQFVVPVSPESQNI